MVSAEIDRTSRSSEREPAVSRRVTFEGHRRLAPVADLFVRHRRVTPSVAQGQFHDRRCSRKRASRVSRRVGAVASVCAPVGVERLGRDESNTVAGPFLAGLSPSSNDPVGGRWASAFRGERAQGLSCGSLLRGRGGGRMPNHALQPTATARDVAAGIRACVRVD